MCLGSRPQALQAQSTLETGSPWGRCSVTDKGGQVEAGTLAPRVGYLMLRLPQTPRCNLLPSSRVYSGWFGLRWSPRRTTSLQSWSQDLLLRGRTGWGWGRTSQDRGEGSEVERGRTHSEKCCSTAETEKGTCMWFHSHPSLLGWGGSCYYAHFSDAETEAQSGPRSSVKDPWSWDSNLGP